MRLFLFCSLFIFLISCQTLEMDDETTLPTEQLTNPAETQTERKPDYTRYEQSRRKLQEFKRPNVKHNQDEYVNERTEKIADHLNARDDINRSQVVETEEKVIAGVILNLHADKQEDKEIAHSIAKDIEKFVSDNKDIIVYTDYTYWYERIDRDASEEASELGDDLEDMFDGFFEIAD